MDDSEFADPALGDSCHHFYQICGQGDEREILGADGYKKLPGDIRDISWDLLRDASPDLPYDAGSDPDRRRAKDNDIPLQP